MLTFLGCDSVLEVMQENVTFLKKYVLNLQDENIWECQNSRKKEFET